MSSRQEKDRRRRERDLVEADAVAVAARKRSNRRFAVGVLSALLAAAVILVVGINQHNATDNAAATASGPAIAEVRVRPAPDARSVAQAPRPRSGAVQKELATLRRQSSTVVDGDVASRLARLKGAPVVVNVWASWCPNCRAEFGYFQALSKAYAGKVAFLGLDSSDNRGDAERFLKEFPIPYPSINDPSAAQARSVGAGVGWPTTIFYDAVGHRQFVRQGGYASAAVLDTDIRTYAIR